MREAIKVLEGLGLVRVRQGDGATVQPLIDASLDVLPPMIFHGGRIDAAALAEMSRGDRCRCSSRWRGSAIERRRPAQLAALRRLRDVIADDAREREERFAAGATCWCCCPT